MATNVIRVSFGATREVKTSPAYQWDYGQVLEINGVPNLPSVFQVHFSNQQSGGIATIVTGTNGKVMIPNHLLTTAKTVYAWIYVNAGDNDGETEYAIIIPVKARPMPEYYDVGDPGVFDDVVKQVREYYENADDAATRAEGSATAAAGSASAAAQSAAGSASNTVGVKWDVDLNYANGYVEVLIGISDSVNLLDADLPSGVSVNIDLYLDGVLSKRIAKTDKRIESVYLDFADAKKGELRITTNSGANALAANISHIAWYVTGESAEKNAVDPYGTVSMLMDSWGVYCDNAVQTEYARLVGVDANGMPVPLTNHSVGGQTSAWGCGRFYADVWAEHPKYVMIDFGINDVNQGMTQETYCANMASLINAALANDIIPIVLLVGWATTGGMYDKYTLPLISYYAEKVTA